MTAHLPPAVQPHVVSEADADRERDRVGERAVPVVPARVVAGLGDVVHAERELLDALGQEQRHPAERVRHGRAALAGRDPAGQVQVGQQRPTGADRGADGDLQRRLVVVRELIQRPGAGEPRGRARERVRWTHHRAHPLPRSNGRRPERVSPRVGRETSTVTAGGAVSHSFAHDYARFRWTFGRASENARSGVSGAARPLHMDSCADQGAKVGLAPGQVAGAATVGERQPRPRELGRVLGPRTGGVEVVEADPQRRRAGRPTASR